MPQALSSHPDPYQAPWIPGAPNKDYAAGWAYPPKDYAKWGELVYQWARHCAQKYGSAQAASWYWEVWNEPNIFYWQGTPEEYFQLYDYAVAGVRRALPNARVGGPAIAGTISAPAAKFLRAFLTHCATGKNYATGAQGAPLDFVSYHAKGAPEVIDGRVRMGLARHLQEVDGGLKILAAYPRFKNLPVILSESDPEGCAACSARLYPQNAYRNGPLYATYTATVMKAILDLNTENHASVAGMLTWAFEFEGQPYFDGLRTLATNGVDKPILNLFRMAGMLRGERIAATSTAATPLDTLLAKGVRGENPDIDALATRDDRGISILVWNYHDDDVPGLIATIALEVHDLPSATPRVFAQHYRIDATHSNAYSAWQAMGSPQNPTPDPAKATGSRRPTPTPNLAAMAPHHQAHRHHKFRVTHTSPLPNPHRVVSKPAPSSSARHRYPPPPSLYRRTFALSDATRRLCATSPRKSAERCPEMSDALECAACNSGFE